MGADDGGDVLGLVFTLLAIYTWKTNTLQRAQQH